MSNCVHVEVRCVLWVNALQQVFREFAGCVDVVMEVNGTAEAGKTRQLFDPATNYALYVVPRFLRDMH